MNPATPILSILGLLLIIYWGLGGHNPISYIFGVIIFLSFMGGIVTGEAPTETTSSKNRLKQIREMRAKRHEIIRDRTQREKFDAEQREQLLNEHERWNLKMKVKSDPEGRNLPNEDWERSSSVIADFLHNLLKKGE